LQFLYLKSGEIKSEIIIEYYNFAFYKSAVVVEYFLLDMNFWDFMLRLYMIKFQRFA
jgi:hypothetical protein